MITEREALLIAEPYIVEALARHDEAYDRHPATEAERQIILDDLEAVRKALQQLELEPVAWMTHSNDLLPLFHKTRESALNWGAEPIPLYTTPPQRPSRSDMTWVGLSDKLKLIFIKEAPNWTVLQLIEEIETTLKNNNT